MSTQVADNCVNDGTCVHIIPAPFLLMELFHEVSFAAGTCSLNNNGPAAGLKTKLRDPATDRVGLFNVSDRGN